VKISNEIKIGLLAVIVISASVWGYQFLRGRNIIQSASNYYVRYENIDQLAPTSAVMIRGMNIGTVSKLELDDDMKTIIATLTIDRHIRIPKDAEAVIVATGLMGGKAIDIKFDNPCSGPDCAESGDFLQGRIRGVLDSFLDKEEGGTLDEIKTNIGDVIRSVGDSLTSPDAKNEIAKTYQDLSKLIHNLASVTGVLDKSMGAYDRKLQASLSDINVLTGALAANQDKIASTIAHLESLSAQLDSARVGDQAGSLLTEANAAVKSLDKTMAEANATFAQLTALTSDLQAGKGTMGKMMKDEALYDNLTRTSKNLDLLLQDFRLNPKRYVNVSVFGKKQKEYDVPEDDPAFKE
jgi:phospholipid/cholesterol/gamma-HCH transport system substrate-binding protein